MPAGHERELGELSDKEWELGEPVDKELRPGWGLA
jgi:hypothetical protein